MLPNNQPTAIKILEDTDDNFFELYSEPYNSPSSSEYESKDVNKASNRPSKTTKSRTNKKPLLNKLSNVKASINDANNSCNNNKDSHSFMSHVNKYEVEQNKHSYTSLMLYKETDTKVLFNNIVTDMWTEHNIKITIEDLDLLNIERLSYDLKVPTKIETAIRTHIPKSALTAIHNNHDIAVDYCMILCSMINYSGDDTQYTSIASSRFVDLFGMRTYPKIIKALTKGTKQKGAIIECDDSYIVGGKSLGYRFTPTYVGKGKIKYDVKTTEGKDVLLTLISKKISNAICNPIANRILKSYSHVTLPTDEQILEEAKRLEGKVLKNGKKLKFLNGQSRTLYVDDKYSFVEENIKLYKFLTDDGLFIPIIGGERAGGRVADSFTLMPSWIRSLCTINGVPMSSCEYDFKSLHPNLAFKLYDFGDETEFISGASHQKVASMSGIDIADVKKCHLSFFNQEIWQMEQSPLHYFYKTYCPDFLGRIKSIKRKYGYKQISSDLFTFEVEIMTEVIKRLPDDVKVIYVYDALYSDDVRVKDIMNDVVKHFEVSTYVG